MKIFFYSVVAFLLATLVGVMLAGCSDTPEQLKLRDEGERRCKQECAPREFKSRDFIGCHCVDEKAP
jgi:hypothetical protein